MFMSYFETIENQIGKSSAKLFWEYCKLIGKMIIDELFLNCMNLTVSQALNLVKNWNPQYKLPLIQLVQHQHHQERSLQHRYHFRQLLQHQYNLHLLWQYQHQMDKL